MAMDYRDIEQMRGTFLPKGIPIYVSREFEDAQKLESNVNSGLEIIAMDYDGVPDHDDYNFPNPIYDNK